MGENRIGKNHRPKGLFADKGERSVLLGVGFLLLLISALFSGLSGCTGLQQSGPIRGIVATDSHPLHPGVIIDLGSGQQLSFERFMDKIESARVIYLGEIHDSPEVHRFQKRVIEAFCRRREPIVVAMEMFTAEVQPVLDQWRQGKLSEGRFLKKVGWQQQWGYPYSLYRGILEACKSCGVRLVGINLPHQLVRKIARKGLSALNAKERAMVANRLDESRQPHRRLIEEEFKRHPPMGFKDFDAFYQAQLAWEETMAQNLAEILRQSDKASRIVVLVGKGHVEYRLGVPQRAADRLEHPYKIVVPVTIDEIKQGPGRKLADYALVVANRYHHGQRAKLGVMVIPLKNGGYRVVRIAKKSPAATGGVKIGDILLRVDGFPIKKVSEIRNRLSRWSGYHSVLVRRDGRVLTIVVHVDNEKGLPTEQQVH